MADNVRAGYESEGGSNLVIGFLPVPSGEGCSGGASQWATEPYPAVLDAVVALVDRLQSPLPRRTLELSAYSEMSQAGFQATSHR